MTVRRLAAAVAALALVAAANPETDWFVETHVPGDNVAVSGDWAIVTNRDNVSPGTATVYQHDGTAWSLYQELEPSGGLSFGRSVAIDGDVAAVGEDGGVQVYEFDGSTWVGVAELVSSNPDDVGFGTDVDVDGSTIAVGTIAEAAYVFVHGRRGWSQQARLTASDSDENDRFGRDVAVDNDTVVVGATGWDNPDVGPGAAYVFDRAGHRWFESAILTPSEIHWPGVWFGLSVDVDGDTVAVSGGFWENGAAWVFERNRRNWDETEIFRSVNADGIFFFGRQIAIDGDQIAVAAPGGFLSSSNGEILIFRERAGSWLLEQRVQTGNPLVEEEFGHPFSLSGDVLAGVIDYPESEVYLLRR